MPTDFDTQIPPRNRVPLAATMADAISCAAFPTVTDRTERTPGWRNGSRSIAVAVSFVACRPGRQAAATDTHVWTSGNERTTGPRVIV
ncbi:hypothetical protein [Micromonospora sp. NPDC005194]|uniref:hypothetical protein n=1 Tax=unclassified Micromonospora TaxID=2617518 RepID=UPI0033A444B4